MFSYRSLAVTAAVVATAQAAALAWALYLASGWLSQSLFGVVLALDLVAWYGARLLWKIALRAFGDANVNP